MHKQVLASRNAFWEGNKYIPKWVDVEKVGLDQFFTRPEMAEYCHGRLLDFLKKEKVDMGSCQFIEPGVGAGSFYDLLPKRKRIGIDIMPLKSGITQTDFLSWQPVKKNGRRYISVGNPPFGSRAWLALAFMKHAATFSDYVGFILPMAFQSEGKGNPKDRVPNMNLVSSEILPSDSFVNAEGNRVKINALWQIWKAGSKQETKKKTCSDWIDLFTVDMRKERLCGQERFNEVDYFLQRTFFRNPPKLVKDFLEVKYVCGYGIVLKKKKSELTKLLHNTDWRLYSNLATHNCRHISMHHIRKVLIDSGYIDG